MADCRWREPRLVGQFGFLEWPEDGHLRHTRFIALCEDKDASTVVREPWAAQLSELGVRSVPEL